MPSMLAVDESYFDRAPQRYSRTWSIAQPAEAVWAELTGDRPLHWCRGLTIAWTSPRPFAVGTTRSAKVLGGVMSGDERFFVWEEGRRYSFHFTRGNLPVFESLAEDYRVEPDGEDRCRFTWTVALTPTRLGAAGGPLNKALFNGFFRDTGRYFGAA